jgi:putative phosphoesterase
MVDHHRVEGRSFGLLADTHDDAVDWPAAVAKIGQALGEVDAIIHCGDLRTAKAIETLNAIAPVWATRNSMDPPAAPPRLLDGPRVLEADGLRLGVVFQLTGDPVGAELDGTLRFPKLGPRDACKQLFGGPVDVCVFGGTHAPVVASAAGTLFVNPGSPTLAKTRSVGVLTLAGGVASVEIRPVA